MGYPEYFCMVHVSGIRKPRPRRDMNMSHIEVSIAKFAWILSLSTQHGNTERSQLLKFLLLIPIIRKFISEGVSGPQPLSKNVDHCPYSLLVSDRIHPMFE